MSTPWPARATSWLRATLELLREENLRRIEAHLTEVAKLAASCDLTREDVFNIYDVLSGEETV